MHPRNSILTIAFLLTTCCVVQAQSIPCRTAGPQTPRDITSSTGTNSVTFPVAPAATGLNLCNIHFHKNAEHKGPGFAIPAGEGEYGGYRCGQSGDAPEVGKPVGELTACENVQAGDTIEVHWVHSSCDVRPGEGLGACLTEDCADPLLRVETQVFLVVDDRDAADFEDFSNAAEPVGGFYQAKALPTGNGDPVTFLGSTTGPKFNDRECSPAQVTWSVRPQCARVDIESLQAWCRENDFNERRAQGVRQLVTDPRFLSEIP